MRVLVTGAGRGIGLELCRQLSARGDDVIGTVRDPTRAAALAATGATVETLDVSDGASARALSERFAGRPLDVLVNNAGRGGAGAGIATLDCDLLRAYFDTNSLGPLRTTQALLGALRAGAGRKIVSLTSNLASIAANHAGGLYGYRASKAALNMLNRSLAAELAGEGFTCVVVHPGWVKTDMGGPRAPLAPTDAVAALVRLIDGLGQAMNGRFLSYTGEPLSW
jgi:NAD(P)-dependent dehydrogenase (short-subunit alcohol dehydrogenase family)